MDFLIENNLMTQRRIIIDVGHQKTKILFVTYKKNKMTVESCIMMDSEPWMQDIMELAAPEKLAEAVYDLLKSNAHYRKAEIAILLPSEMFQIEAIELNDIANKKDLEEQLDKSVKSSANARNLRESTTVIDSTVFGTYEQGGRIIYSCAMLSLPKAVADSIYKAFREKGLNITHLSDGHLGLAYISELYVDDYEHVSKLFLDVGVYSTRVMIQSERVCVYWHEIPMGVSTFINDVVENMGFLEDEAANILLGDESSFEEHDIEAIKNATEH
ncbi:MAG: hypothetical protein PUF72_03180, partial [Clostridiales bacterium]|nr:hypothetical protein [Clostridiales bacterium]